MKYKLRSLIVIVLLGLLALASLASRAYVPLFQDATATPVLTPTKVVVQGKVGTTDGIAILGILIFVVIVLAIAFRFKELRASER